MSISAGQVKELRERTGAGMMECKKALMETSGDIEAAIEWMRKTGLAKAAKKAGRVAAEGVIVIRVADNKKSAVMVEINSETDFVARDQNFQGFAERVGQVALQNPVENVEALLEVATANQNLDHERQELVAKIGENIQLRRMVRVNAPGCVGAYVHSGRIGVLVALSVANEELAKDIAMHIAATNPQAITPKDVSAELIAKEKEVFSAQAAQSGKPAAIIEKMVEGRIQKYLSEISLTEQPFVKNPDQKISDLLKAAQAQVLQFVRFELGEGIEKETQDFAGEVMAQVRRDS